MSAKWITVNGPYKKTGLYIFKKSFIVSESPSLFNVKISADTRYKLYINGKEICHGPCVGGRFKKYYEETECSNALKIGENEITVKVIYNSDGKTLITSHRDYQPALYFEGILTCANSQFEICSDETFEACLDNRITFEIRRNIMSSVGPFESVGAEQAYEPLETAVLCESNIELSGYSPWGVAGKYLLEKRPLPLFFAGENIELTPIREYTAEDGKYNIIFDSVTYTTAMLTYEYLAETGTEIKTFYAECALTKGEDGKLYKGLRDEPYGVIDSTAFDVLYANGSAQKHELFSYRAFRYIRVECDKKPEYIRILAARYTYDYEKCSENGGVGYFESSNPLHKKIWDISRNTLECCTHETVVDCPFYEQQQYMMDGGLESLFAWRLSNDSHIQKKLLLDMAQSQNAEGLISANYPNIDLQIIPGFSLYFVMGVREYLRNTGDASFVRQMTGICDRILEYFGRTSNELGLVMPDYGWLYLDWVSGWKHGVPNGAKEAPMTAYNLMYATALNAAAEICDMVNRPGLSTDYKAAADKIILTVNEKCFDKEKGLYTDVYGIKSYSEHTAVWAILSGAVTGNDAAELMEKTMTDAEVSKCSFSMRYYLLRALEASGCYDKYADAVLSGWKVMLDNHCTTWCEDAVTCRSECHGWSSTPMYEMSAMILGVKPVGDGFCKVLIKPHTLGLKYAKGRVPVPGGYIDVSWKYTDGKFTLDVNSNKIMTMEIVLPGGRSMTVTDNKVSVTE